MITADVIVGGNERQTLEPLIDEAHQELVQARVTETVRPAVADAEFWNTDQIARLTDRRIRTLVSPDAGNRKTPVQTRQRGKHYLEMREQLATDQGKELYRQRQAIIEPVFAQTQAQPMDRSVPTKRLMGLQGRVATGHSDPQPPQALAAQPGDRHRIAGEDPAPEAPDPTTPDHANRLAPRRSTAL